MIDKAKILYQIDLMDGILRDFKKWVLNLTETPQKTQAELKFSGEQTKSKKHKGRQKSAETIKTEKEILRILTNAPKRLEPNEIVKLINEENQNGKQVDSARVRRLLFRLKQENKVQVPRTGFWEIVKNDR